MKNVGFVGWRGIVGSVLLQRMFKKNNINHINLMLFSTSVYGSNCTIFDKKKFFIYNAFDLSILKSLDIILTCQGSSYTNSIYYSLRKIGWVGYWIDSSYVLRMKKSSVIVLDPVNEKYINKSLNNGIKTFIGSNCTVSLMLMALGGLFSNNLISWVSSSTYQAVSGAGSKHLKELLIQMNQVSNCFSKYLKNSFFSTLYVEKKITSFCKSKNILVDKLNIPLVCNLVPWIDKDLKNGQSKEEWKNQVEVNKILNTSKNIPISSTCVRINTLRCHSQSLLVKLKKDISVKEIYNFLANHNKWINIISNNRKDTFKKLSPLYVSGTLNILIGRLRKIDIGKKYFSLFTIGDQLLWGASEPIRRMLCKLI